jgi:chromosome segregation ATPase
MCEDMNEEAETFAIYSRQATVEVQAQLANELKRAHAEIAELRAKLAIPTDSEAKEPESVVQSMSVKDAQQSLPALRDLFVQCETLLLENDSLKNQVVVLNDQKDTLASVADSVKGEAEVHEHALSVALAEKVALEAEREALTASCDQLRGDYEDLLKDHEELQEEHEEVCTEAEYLKQDVQSMIKAGTYTSSGGMSVKDSKTDGSSSAREGPHRKSSESNDDSELDLLACQLH